MAIRKARPVLPSEPDWKIETAPEMATARRTSPRTTAADVMARYHCHGVTDVTDTGSALAANGPTSLPLPLVLLAAVSLVVLSAGGFGYVVRRRRSTD